MKGLSLALGEGCRPCSAKQGPGNAVNSLIARRGPEGGENRPGPLEMSAPPPAGTPCMLAVHVCSVCPGFPLHLRLSAPPRWSSAGLERPCHVHSVPKGGCHGPHNPQPQRDSPKEPGGDGHMDTCTLTTHTYTQIHTDTCTHTEITQTHVHTSPFPYCALWKEVTVLRSHCLEEGVSA